MSFGLVNKFIRLFFIWIFALALLVGAFIAIYRLQTRQEIEVNYKIIKECPEDVGMDEAYFDAQLQINDQEGLMHCWCYSEVIQN